LRVFSFLAPIPTLFWTTTPGNKLKVATVCQIPLAPTAVIQDSHPPWAEMIWELLWLDFEVAVMILTANVGGRGALREINQPAFQVVFFLFWLSCNSRQLTDLLNWQ
jgi:hypothetical protein